MSSALAASLEIIILQCARAASVGDLWLSGGRQRMMRVRPLTISVGSGGGDEGV